MASVYTWYIEYFEFLILVHRSLEHPENKTYSSLVAFGSTLGELRAVRLRWTGEEDWSSWWRRVTTMMSRGGGAKETELVVSKIRLKCGESQEK